jgi:flagellar motor protein MotB
MEATPMKLVGIISTAVLSLTLGAAVPVYAQQEEHAQQEEKQAQQEDKKAQPDKPAQQEEKKAQQEEKKTQTEKPAQQDEKKAQQQEKKTQAEKPAQQDEKKAQQEKPAQHDQQAQRADGNHGRIPDDRFRANFGREHVFIINRPVIVEGRPRFQYGGYWFGFSQPWPVGWLYTDNVYVDFVDGGYYLYNPFHPGIRVVIIVI